MLQDQAGRRKCFDDVPNEGFGKVTALFYVCGTISVPEFVIRVVNSLVEIASGSIILI
jgi:hypothetical protein